MRILMINTVCGIRSTGRICTDLAARLEEDGHEVKIAYGRGTVPKSIEKYAVRIGNETDVIKHAVTARLTDGSGFGSRTVTERFIRWVREYDPDIIHLHNIHGYYINIEVLFEYLRSCGKRIIWTLHDCWSFTGHAAYCEEPLCEKWQNGCTRCSKIREYPASLIDRSEKNWHRKKELFTGIPDLTIVTPSRWLADLVGRSYLSEYEVKVIHNGIDLRKFHPIPSEIKKTLGIENRKMILGVAALWEDRKGLKDFLQLSRMLDHSYAIVLVGLPEKQIASLPEEIIGMGRTDTVEDLARLYTAADVYVNPTYEDNYPTTNLEAIACGTPVVTYATGGSGESAIKYGIAVEKGNVEQLKQAIMNADWNNVSEIDPDIDVKTCLKKYSKMYLPG